MATFEPALELFERQFESIQRQTHRDFICIISDDGSSHAVGHAIERMCSSDERFRVIRNADRLGYYLNFERCLSRVPPEISIVALSDQDDVWHPDKLETLLRAMQPDRVKLAFADMAIVSPGGELIAPSYWTDRSNNFTDLGSLLLTNSVTGAASAFKRELLETAIPFPDAPGPVFHDHWIACVALAIGEIAFIERPLHDYVQHAGNVIGRHEPLAGELKGGLVNALLRLGRNPRRRLRTTVNSARGYYEEDVVAREAFARTLSERLQGLVAAEDATTIRRVAEMSTSLRSLLWLLGRSARDVRGNSPTVGIENQLIKGILWRRFHGS